MGRVMFSALPLMWRLGSYAVIAVAALALYAGWHRHVYNLGYSAAIAEIAAADNAATDRVKAGMRDIASCRAHGGTWDVVTGRCT